MSYKKMHPTWECVTPFVECKVRGKKKPPQKFVAGAEKVLAAFSHV